MELDVKQEKGSYYIYEINNSFDVSSEDIVKSQQ